MDGVYTLQPSELPVKAQISSSRRAKPLFCKGSRRWLESTRVAVVGPRNADAKACAMAWRIARFLVDQGYCVISGLALGIDAQAHQGGLRNTVAVLAHGLDHTYPPGHLSLRKEILKNNGALLTEYPEGTSITKSQLLNRTELQVLLADATIVINPVRFDGGGTFKHFTYAKYTNTPILTPLSMDNEYDNTGGFRLIQEYNAEGFGSLAELKQVLDTALS